MSARKIRDSIRAPLPSPPPGFVWRLCGEASILKPAHWHEREQVSTIHALPVITYTTSPEHWCEEKPFELGLTLHVLSGSRKIAEANARQMVFAYLRPLFDADQKKKGVLLFKRSTNGAFESTVFQFRDNPPGRASRMVLKCIAANTTTDRVHAFTFESPIATWDENWARYGNPMLSKTGVDSAPIKSPTHDNRH